MPGKPKVPYQSVVDCFQKHGNAKDAAQELGISTRTVSQAFLALGLRARVVRKKYKAPNISSIQPLYEDQKMSTTEVARLVGSSAEAVRQCLIDHGIPRRNQGAQHGEKNPSWSGGVIIDKNGYRLLHAPSHPLANSGGYVREHRLVMEEKLGRHLARTEVVHHIDGDHANNDPENLCLFASNADHLKHELTGRVPSWTPEGKRRMGRRRKNQPEGQKA